MKAKSKDVKLLLLQLRTWKGLGVLGVRVEEAEAELLRLDHAIAVRDTRAARRAIDAVCRVICGR